MACANPSPETRFGAIRGNPPGRPSIRWLQEKVEAIDPDTGKTVLQTMADHLIEVATKWEVIQRGESMPVASARDSVEACRLLWQALSILRKTPPSEEEQVLKLAEHLRGVAKDAADLAIKVLGTRLYSMDPKELGQFMREASGNPAGFLEAAKAQAATQGEVVEARVSNSSEPFAPVDLSGMSSAPIPAQVESPPTPDAAPVLADSDDGWPKP